MPVRGGGSLPWPDAPDCQARQCVGRAAMRERDRGPHRPGKPHRGGQPQRRSRGQRGSDRATSGPWRQAPDAPWILYGWHPGKAALENPARRIRRLYATENAARRLAEDGVTLPLAPDLVRPDAIAARLGPDAVHQGLLAEADPLPAPEL